MKKSFSSKSVFKAPFGGLGAFVFLFFFSFSFSQEVPKTQNVILVTFDGYRWQEMFKGAEKKLINESKLVKDIPALKKNYWAGDKISSREKVTPFIWNTIAKQGSIIGERKNASKMQVTNIHRFSYPGYSEIFSGWANNKINSNDYPDNPNYTIWDFLQADEKFKNKIFATATWDAFTRIINTKRNGVPVQINLKNENGIRADGKLLYEKFTTTIPASNGFITDDSLTYHVAKEYIVKNHPRFAFIGFDETDHFGHEGQYDSYLHSANQLDGYMQDLWNFIQSDPQYKGNTTLIITCDHGRGHLGKHMWQHHGGLAFSSNKIWLAAIGAGIKKQGVVKKGHFYQKQIAATITQLFGKKFSEEKKIGKSIEEILK